MTSSLYAQHGPILHEYAQSSPEAMARVAIAAIASANWPFARWPAVYQALLDQRRVEGVTTIKLEAAAYWLNPSTAEVRYKRWRALANMTSVWGKETVENHLLANVIQTTGLNLVKGGFFLQMAFGLSGCVDTRNSDTYGIRQPRPVRNAIYQHATRYNRLIRDLGGTAHLWDTWCRYYADSAEGTTPWRVSARHCELFGLNPGVEPTDADEAPF